MCGSTYVLSSWGWAQFWRKSWIAGTVHFVNCSSKDNWQQHWQELGKLAEENRQATNSRLPRLALWAFAKSTSWEHSHRLMTLWSLKENTPAVLLHVFIISESRADEFFCTDSFWGRRPASVVIEFCLTDRFWGRRLDGVVTDEAKRKVYILEFKQSTNGEESFTRETEAYEQHRSNIHTLRAAVLKEWEFE